MKVYVDKMPKNCWDCKCGSKTRRQQFDKNGTAFMEDCVRCNFNDKCSIKIQKECPLQILEEEVWYHEFANVERTERLLLPTWEEFSNRVKNISFNVDQIRYYCYTDGRYVEIKECYSRGYNIDDRVFFSKLLTKENYILACRKCKELFIGENIENE